MKKRLLSITLALSIVASLFAGLSFSASATEYTDYTAVGANGKANIADTGKDATKSLIGDKLPIGTYYYNTYSDAEGIAIAEEPTEFLSNIDPVGDKDRYIGNLTDETNLTTSATIFDDEKYIKHMWAHYADGKVSQLINDETKRWAQLNYELDGEATINTFIFGALSTSGTFASHFWQMPGHYKVIFSNTEEGLFDHSQAVAVIDVDETKNAAFKTNRHVVTLNTPVTAKYVGFRMICGFNTSSVGVAAASNIYMDRFMHFSVFGNYTTPAVLPEGEATATTVNLDGEVITGVEATASLATVGNNDDANNYASAGAKLSAAESAKLGAAYYVFKGWYLGDTLVTDKAVANYAFTGAEENMNFVAKYESTYEPYTDYTAAGKSNVADLTDIGKDPARSLIVGKVPYEGKFYNTIENDKNIAVTSEPTAFELNDAIGNFTDASALTSSATTFKSVDYTKHMWAYYGSDGKVNQIINDEANRWSQINYELDGQATINTFVYGLLNASVGGQYWQMPGHYKVIFSDTKEGLFNLEQANAVIEVDETKDATFRTNRHTITLNTPVTAKYVGLRMICGFNNASVGVAAASNIYMDRVSHFSVYGEYTTPATLPDKDVTATVKDENGNALEGITASAALATVGNVDESGDYASAGIKLNAPEAAEVGDKYYAFTGWYLGETLVTDKAVADYVYTGAEENLDFVVKYVKTYKPYTDYTAAGKSNVGDLNDISKDPAKSLIANKAPYEGYVYNTIENENNIAVTEEPAKFELNKDIGYLTDTDLNTQGTTFKSVDYTKYMWAEYESGKVSKLINDESKRWSQINYALDGQATINTVVYGLVMASAGGQFWQMPGHYKVIFSNTEEGLFDLEKATAVIEVDETKNAEFKKNRHTLTLNTPVTAKYVGFRMICGFNNASINTAAQSNIYMDRVSHFGVYGTYTADLTGEVNVAIEEGLPSTLVSKSDVVYVGGVDDNGNYGAANVTVTAAESYEDETAGDAYTFAGWYNGDAKVSADAEYAYDLTKGSVTLTAKYSVQKICATKGHKYTNYVYNEDATCLEDGTKTASCDYGCGEKDTITAEGTKFDHKYTDYVYNNDATCQKDGTKTAVCDYECGVGTHTVTATGTKKAHTYGANYVSAKATLTADGAISKKCACGAVAKVSTISKIKTVSIAASATYTGKAIKPKVTVKDAAGKTVTSYKVVYSNNTKVGKATAKITFSGNYSGTKTLTFKIVPKKTSISSLKAGKKSLTVKYKKQTSGTGYEIQYSTSSKFKSAKTVKISKNKTVSKTIKKLKSKKTYYVRVRVVKGSYKSSWSTVKKVKVK